MSRINYLRFSILLTIFSLLMVFKSALGQTEQAIQTYLAEGTKLRNGGQYEQALEKYNQALLLNQKHDQANYLMALTYFDMAEYGKCVLHCNKAINLYLSAYEREAYFLKGKALLEDNQPKEAAQMYNKMLVDYPEDYLVYYNLGLSYYNSHDYANAEIALSDALELRPSFADAHLLLGTMMMEKGERMKSVMAFVNFLLLEPNGARAKKVYPEIQKQLSKGFNTVEDNMAAFSLAAQANIDEFSSANSMAMLFENGKEETQEQFAHNTELLFERLATMKKETNFWWDFYVNFYNDMNYNKHIETLCYFISQSKNNEDTKQWLMENNHKVTQMIDWVNQYNR